MTDLTHFTEATERLRGGNNLYLLLTDLDSER